uniref:Uncharacterized protein n=1 Tax=Arundo donax TaxID=35708 RepID=A0A0A8ZP52_ARUDO
MHTRATTFATVVVVSTSAGHGADHTMLFALAATMAQAQARWKVYWRSPDHRASPSLHGRPPPSSAPLRCGSEAANAPARGSPRRIQSPQQAHRNTR